MAEPTTKEQTKEQRQALIFDQVDQAVAWEEGRARLMGHDVERRGPSGSTIASLACRKCQEHADGSQVAMLEDGYGKPFLRITSRLGITPCPREKP